jgi:hypothetical protein
MKKILLFAILLSAISFVGNAQTIMTNPNGYPLDTATQAVAKGPKLQVKSSYKTVSIVLNTTKISGTIAGTVAYQGSNDGVAWYTISTATLVDASTVYGYKEVDKAFLYYKCLITQTGTSSLSYNAYLYTTTTPKSL